MQAIRDLSPNAALTRAAVLALAVIAAPVIALAEPEESAFEVVTQSPEPRLSFSGRFETDALALFAEDDGQHYGFRSTLRLRASHDAADWLSFTAEAELPARDGVGWAPGYLEASGMPPALARQGGAPRREFELDYLYADIAAGPLDIRIGRQPIAWGSAYAFNPTDIGNPTSLAELTGIEPPGLTAVHAGLMLSDALSIEGYLGFEDRSRSLGPGSDLDRPGDLPFALRLRGFAGAWDYGIGFGRAVEQTAAGLARDDALLAEIAGPIGPMDTYGELRLGLGDGDQPLARRLDLAIGARYETEGGLGLQAEYHRRGGGATGPGGYDPQDLLARRLAGRDYAVLVIDRSWMNDRLRGSIAGIVNTNDRSFTLAPELDYELSEDVFLGLGAQLFGGASDSEFGGGFTAPGGTSLNLNRPVVRATATVHF